MNRIPLLLLLTIFIFSCKESNHNQSINNNVDNTNNNSVQNLDSLLNKTYDELINEGIVICKNEKNLTKAFPYFQTAWIKDSNRVEANYWLACVHSLGSNEYNSSLKSLNYLNKAIAINKNYRNALRQRGVIKMKIHDYEGALNDFDEGIVMNANDTALYLDRHFAKLILKDKKGACDDLLEAKKLGSIIAIDKYKTTCESLQ